MKRLLAAAAAASLLAAAGPVLAAAPAKHGACKAPSDAIVVQPGGAQYETVTPTPVGAGAGLTGSYEEQVGTFYLDLQGQPASTRGSITFTLSWLNPVSDYDLIVNGANELSSDNPEISKVKAKHCRALKVGVDVFLGVPVDEITLTAKGA
jgi:hypothetical protein